MRGELTRGISTDWVSAGSALGRVDWPATLQARVARGADGTLGTLMGEKSFDFSDLRFQPHTPRPQWLHCVVLDASGSMRRAWGEGENFFVFNDLLHRMSAADAMGRLPLPQQRLLAIAAHAYRGRAHWALIRFGAGGAALLDAPRRAHAPQLLPTARLHVGGGSPVTQALELAAQTMARYQRRICAPSQQTALQTVVWLITDGRFRTLARPLHDAHIVVVDAEPAGPRRLGGAQRLAAAWGAGFWGG